MAVPSLPAAHRNQQCKLLSCRKQNKKKERKKRRLRMRQTSASTKQGPAQSTISPSAICHSCLSPQPPFCPRCRLLHSYSCSFLIQCTVLQRTLNSNTLNTPRYCRALLGALGALDASLSLSPCCISHSFFCACVPAFLASAWPRPWSVAPCLSQLPYDHDIRETRLDARSVPRPLSSLPPTSSNLFSPSTSPLPGGSKYTHCLD